MQGTSRLPTPMPPPGAPRWQVVRRRPSSRLGWWAIGLMGLFVLLWIINTVVFMPLFMYGAVRSPAWMPFYGIFMVLCGLASGLAGLVAVIWRRERSWLVLLTLMPGLAMVVLLLGEFLVPH